MLLDKHGRHIYGTWTCIILTTTLFGDGSQLDTVSNFLNGLSEAIVCFILKVAYSKTLVLVKNAVGCVSVETCLVHMCLVTLVIMLRTCSVVSQ